MGQSNTFKKVDLRLTIRGKIFQQRHNNTVVLTEMIFYSCLFLGRPEELLRKIQVLIYVIP